MERSRRRDPDKNLQGGSWGPSKKRKKVTDNVGHYSREIDEGNERARGRHLENASEGDASHAATSKRKIKLKLQEREVTTLKRAYILTF